MGRFLYRVAVMLCLTSPVFAQQDLQTIGQIEAEFDGDVLSQTTVSYLEGATKVGTASLTTVSGYTSLSIYAAEGRPVSIEAMYANTAAPDPASRPLNTTISYFPSGLTPHWTSEGAPEPVKVTFEVLDTATDTPRARGTFEAVLCLLADLGDEADIENCKPIRGRFDTQLVRD